MITVDDFVQWKDNRVTKAWLEAIDQRIEDAKDILSTQAGVDTDSDNFYRGFIYAYREMLEFSIEENQE